MKCTISLQILKVVFQTIFCSNTLLELKKQMARMTIQTLRCMILHGLQGYLGLGFLMSQLITMMRQVSQHVYHLSLYFLTFLFGITNQNTKQVKKTQKQNGLCSALRFLLCAEKQRKTLCKLELHLVLKQCLIILNFLDIIL